MNPSTSPLPPYLVVESVKNNANKSYFRLSNDNTLLQSYSDQQLPAFCNDVSAHDALRYVSARHRYYAMFQVLTATSICLCHTPLESLLKSRIWRKVYFR